MKMGTKRFLLEGRLKVAGMGIFSMGVDLVPFHSAIGLFHSDLKDGSCSTQRAGQYTLPDLKKVSTYKGHILIFYPFLCLFPESSLESAQVHLNKSSFLFDNSHTYPFYQLFDLWNSMHSDLTCQLCKNPSRSQTENLHEHV